MAKLTKTGRVAVNSQNEKRYLTELVDILKQPRRYDELTETVKQFGIDRNLTDSGLRRLETRLSTQNFLKEIPLKWSATAPSPRRRLYSTRSIDTIHPLEVAIALHRKSYLCYHTALFWNHLTEQVPSTFYIAVERPATSPPPHRSSSKPEPLDDFVLRDVFLKAHTEHTNVATFRASRFVAIARAYSGAAGVDRRTVHFEDRAVEISVTGLERTLLDCIAVPEDAGGVGNVIEAVKTAGSLIDFDKFSALYDQLAFKYPHWQRIGLLFTKLGFDDFASRWKARFGNPRNKFFLARGYRLEWEFDDMWSVYYPAGLLD